MKKFLSILIITFLFIPLNIANASSGTYSIDKVDIKAIVNEDGIIDVIETQDYVFNGEFNGVFRDFNLTGNSSYEIKEVSILDSNNKEIKASNNFSGENNTYEVYNENNYTRVKVYSKSKNESKKLVINYKIHNSDLYLDANNLPVLNWNFYSVQNVDLIKSATLSLSLKNYDLSDNNSRYETDVKDTLNTFYKDGSIVISYDNLSSGNIVAIKATLPANYFNVNLSNNIPYEENNNSINYNPDYNLVNDKDDGSPLFIIAIVIVIGIVVTYSISKYIKAEREKFEESLSIYRDGYLFDSITFCDSPPADRAPALVNILVNEGRLDKNMITPSLFYLVNKGYYEVSESTYVSSKLFKSNEKDLKFKLNNSLTKPKEKHLRYLMSWFSIYATNNEFSLLSIKNTLKKNHKAEEFIKKQNRWEEIVREDADAIKFFHQVYKKEVISNEYVNEKNSWTAYASYIPNVMKNSTSNLNYLDINDLLVYALALNINVEYINEFCKVLKVKSSNNNYEQNNYIPYPFMYSYYPLFYLQMSQIHDNSTTYSTPSDTSSGGGFTGGFGGGGFSGGGGGGGGAF